MLIIASCGDSSFAQAAEITLSGKVQSKGIPVEGASVVFKSLVHGAQTFAITNELGEFKLLIGKSWLPGTFSVSAIGYMRRNVFADDSTEIRPILVIELAEDSTTLVPVEVLAKLPVRVDGDTTTIAVKSFATGSERNLASLFQQLPGFTLNSDGSLSYRGLRISKVLFEYDDLVGRDYEQMIKSVVPDGVKEVQVLQNYSDNDDILSEQLMPRQTVVNLNFADSLRLRKSGAASVGAGWPLYSIQADGQLLALMKRSKTLLFAGANNVGNFSIDAFLAPWQSQSDREISELGLIPPISTLGLRPEKIPVENLTNYLSPASITSQTNHHFRYPGGWQGRIGVQYLSDEGDQLRSLSTKYFLNDSAILQEERNASVWKHRRISLYAKLSRQWQHKRQIIAEVKYGQAQLNFHSAFDFLSNPGLSSSLQTDRQLGARIIYNQKTSVFAQRLEGEAYIGKGRTTLEIQSDPFLSSILGTVTKDEKLTEDGLSGIRGLTLRYSLGFGRKNQFQWQSSAEFSRRQLNNQWSLMNEVLPPAKVDSLVNSSESWKELTSRFRHRFKLLQKAEVSYGANLVLFKAEQTNVKLASSSAERAWILPFVQAQYKIKNGKIVGIVSSLNAEKSPWLSSVQGVWLPNNMGLSYGAGLVSRMIGHSTSLYFSSFSLSRNKPSVYGQVLYTANPLFVISDFMPGANSNQTVFSRSSAYRNLLNLTATLQSPALVAKWRYSIGFSAFYLSTFNQFNGALQKIPVSQYSLRLSAHLDISSWGKLIIVDQVGYMQQSVEGKIRAESLINNITTQFAAKWGKGWGGSLRLTHFINPAANMQSVFSIGADISKEVKKFRLFLHGTNLLNEQKFGNQLVGGGLEQSYASALLPRIIMIGIKYAF